MKRAYLANGVLSAPLFPDGYTVFVDSTTAAYLNTLLGSDYCYLVINELEVVKVMGVLLPNVLYIERFDENRPTYLPGTSIIYALTPNEIQDAVIQQNLNLASQQAIIISNGNNINYPKVTIEAIGGVGISEPPNSMIEDLEIAACCNFGNLPLPIPINYLQIRIIDGGYRIADNGGFRQYG